MPSLLTSKSWCLAPWLTTRPPGAACGQLLQLVDAIYNLLSKLRLPMGKGLDAILALRRMKLTSEGVEHCVDDEEECQAEW